MGGRLHKVWIMTDTRDNKQKKDAGQRQRSRRQQRTTMRERATASEKSAAVTSARMTAVAMVPDLDLGRGTMVAREQLARRLMRLAAEAKETWRGCARRACRRAKTCHGELPLPCLAAHKGPPMSPEESAWVAADILRALRARRRQLDAEGFAEEI
jgi:hypothetical protein